MKKAIIIPSNTDLNRGDQALVWESIRIVEDVYGKNNVECILMGTLDSSEAIMQNRQTEELGYKMIDTLLKHPGRKYTKKNEDSKYYSKLTMMQWGIQALIDYCRSRLLLSSISIIQRIGKTFLSKKQKETLEAIQTADVIFVKGGGFIHSYGAITDSYYIYYLTYHIRLAEAFNKKVIMLPNSIGPLRNNKARKIVTNCLSKCLMVTVRENISKKCLDDIGVNSTVFPDLGFFLTPTKRDMKNYLESYGVPMDKKKVVFTLRPYRFQGFKNPNELFNNYMDGVKALVDYLINIGYHVTFMAHTLGPSSHENDSLAIKKVMENLSEASLTNITFIEDFNLNCRDVEKIYSYYDYMIGTRFHSVIFSLNVNVPSIAIAYGGNKGKGIMNILGNDDFSIDMDKIHHDTLISIFRNLAVNRDKYLVNLKQKRQIIEKERVKFVTKIREILDE